MDWQHVGNIHTVANRPDRPAKLRQDGQPGHNGHHEHPARKVEGLVDRMVRASSSLPGRMKSPQNPCASTWAVNAISFGPFGRDDDAVGVLSVSPMHFETQAATATLSPHGA